MTRLAVALAVWFVLASAARPARAEVAPLEQAETFQVDGIERFARIDDGVYRGASPTDAGLEVLKRAQVKTLVCLRDAVPYRERAEALGFRVVHIPLAPSEPPSAADIERFLDVVTDPAARPVFFHCRNGEDRTGAMAAIYRMQVQGWPPADARLEMEHFGFSIYWRDLAGFVKAFGSQAAPPTAGLVSLGASLAEALDAASRASAAGRVDTALEVLRRALVQARTRDERVAVARAIVAVLADASARDAPPSGGLELAAREWTVLRAQRAEDGASLARLGAIFRAGLDLARAAEALSRARDLGGADVDAAALGAALARLTTVRAAAPRSPEGRRLGLLDRLSRGELAALLVQELRVDRLPPLPGPPTYEPPRAVPAPRPPAALPGDAAANRHATDIGRVLAQGVRGLERFADGGFHPDEAVSRAELAGVIEDLLSRSSRDATLGLRGVGEPAHFADVDPHAWYRGAAELARALGILGAGGEAGERFRPRDPVTGAEALTALKALRDRLDVRARAVVLVIDALRARSLYAALDGGRLPRLAGLLQERGYVRFERCLAALPADTIPNHTTIFTGALPGRHEITGNEWFDRTLDVGEPLARRSREYLKFGSADDPGLGRAWSFPGFALLETDLAPDVPTIYEALAGAEAARGRKVETAVVFDPVRRGGGEVASPGLLEALFGGKLFGFLEDFPKIDADAAAKAIARIEGDRPPELLGLWFPGLDSWSHLEGPGPAGAAGDRQAGYLERHIDPLIGEVADALDRRGLLAETLLVVSADHGQREVANDARHAISDREVYRALARAGLQVPLDRGGDVDVQSRDVGLVFTGGDNGGAALVSVRRPGAGWGTAPGLDALEPVAAALAAQPFVERIHALGRATGAERAPVHAFVPVGARGGSDGAWTLVETGRRDRLAERLAGLAGSARSGDLFVEARAPYYFAVEGHTYRGEHGGADGEQDHVPLLIVNPPGHPRLAVDLPVGNEDIAPTIAAALGFGAELRSDGHDLLDPPRIRVSSHGEGEVVAAGEVHVLGFAEDALGVEQVEVRLDEQGGYVPARGAEVWEADLVLPPGRHVVDVRARDTTARETTVRFHLEAR